MYIKDVLKGKRNTQQGTTEKQQEHQECMTRCQRAPKTLKVHNVSTTMHNKEVSNNTKNTRGGVEQT